MEHNLYDVKLETFTRDQGIDLCARIAEGLEGKVLVGVSGPEGCGKSLVSDSFLHYFDDDEDTKNIPNEGKSVLEENSGDSLGRVHSKIVSHNNQPVRISIVRDMYDLKNMDEFDGTDIVVFLESWDDLPTDLKPSMTIELERQMSLQDLIKSDDELPCIHRCWGIKVQDQSLSNKLSSVLSILQKESDYRVKRNKPSIKNIFLNVVQRAVKKIKSHQVTLR